tara:strand:- start:1513 stop:1755 length:243 start_codon:yes stop_codon:yes gene_type:complete
MDYTNSTLVTNFKHTGEDVMVFSTDEVTHDKIKRALDLQLLHYNDVIEIPENDRQYHVYESCWLNPDAEINILRFNNYKT